MQFSPTAWLFEGGPRAGIGVSMFVVRTPPGGGVDLHTHPYSETFLLLEDHGLWSVANEVLDLRPNQILVAPPRTPHGFRNVGQKPLLVVSLHESPTLEQSFVGREAAADLSARTRLTTEHLELRPLPAAAAGALPRDRAEASRILGATLTTEWPQPDLLDVLPLQAAASTENERFGVWIMIERESGLVVGDIGLMGPPDEEGSVEIGYSVIPTRRRRGYASEAAQAIADWAASLPEVKFVVASCDRDNIASIRTLERTGFQRTGEDEARIRWRRGSTLGED
jgi:[ribosomal protein S5]-alanine N-acetyltransferase